MARYGRNGPRLSPTRILPESLRGNSAITGGAESLLRLNYLTRARRGWKGRYTCARAARMCQRTVDKLLSFVDSATSSSTIDENERTATHQVWTLLIDGGLKRGERLVARSKRAR